MSLRRRLEQALAVIDAYVPVDGPLLQVGFSMSWGCGSATAPRTGGRS
ncbi:hypothetical protein [Streptomyces sp. NPDC006527]